MTKYQDPPVANFETIQSIVDQLEYSNWKFRLGKSGDGVPFLQILFTDKDRITGKVEVQRCRKWQLSYHMVRSEIVRTAFQAVQAAVLHETQEGFKYRGARVYNPHIDLDSVADAMLNNQVRLSLRTEDNYVPTVTP